MSATLSGLALGELMPAAAILHSEGRSFPVDLEYRPVPSQQLWLDHLCRCVLELATTASLTPHNDVLVFLPGKAEILKSAQYLGERLDSAAFLICPLYGELSGAEQDNAIRASQEGKRKIVLSTKVALEWTEDGKVVRNSTPCLLYTSPSPRD